MTAPSPRSRLTVSQQEMEEEEVGTDIECQLYAGHFIEIISFSLTVAYYVAIISPILLKICLI